MISFANADGQRRAIGPSGGSSTVSFRGPISCGIGPYLPGVPPAEAGEAFVRAAVLRASEFEIVLACDLARYVNVAVALGPEFHSEAKYPWASLILAEPTLSASQKVERLFYWARRTLAQQERSAA